MTNPQSINPPQCNKCGSTGFIANFSGAVPLKFQIVSGVPFLIYDEENESSEVTDVTCANCAAELATDLLTVSLDAAKGIAKHEQRRLHVKPALHRDRAG